MLKVKVYNSEGQQTGELELDQKVFAVTGKPELVHQVLVAHQANSREVLAHTKGRGEVRGGGAKPWKQKGTGRARHSSNRSPIWIGGGVTFGPTKERNFSKKINKKMKQKALFMVLTDKVENGQLIVLEKLELGQGKTKELIGLLKRLPLKKQSAVLSATEKNQSLIRAAKNLRGVDLLAVDSLNIKDLLKREYFILDKPGVEKLVKFYK